MRYIKYCYENGYCGCDDEGVAAYDDGTSDDMIEQSLQEHLEEYGVEYEYCAEGYDWEEGWEDEEAEEDYYANLMFSWEEITEDEYFEWSDPYADCIQDNVDC